MSNDSSEIEIVAQNKFGSPVLVVAVTLVIFIFSQIIGAAAVQLAISAFKLNSNIDNSAAAQFFYVLIAEGLAAFLAIAYIRRKGLRLNSIGLGRRPVALDFSAAMVGFIAYYVVLLIAVSILTSIFPDLNKGTQDVGFNNLSTNFDTLIAFFALVILPPLGEETLVRGFLYSGLRKSMRFIPAMLITSILFGAAHLQSNGSGGILWAAGLNTFILSLVLVKLRDRTGALYAGILVHCLNNLIAFGFHFHI